MKKSIIFYGSAESGKSWIAIGICNLFDDDEVFFITMKQYQSNKKEYSEIFKIKKLVVIDECIGKQDIIKFEKLRILLSNTNFIFTTQTKLNKIFFDFEKYHLVKCISKP